jgi:hypothetical protein
VLLDHARRASAGTEISRAREARSQVRALTLEELRQIIGMDDDEIALIEDMRRQIDDLELDPELVAGLKTQHDALIREAAIRKKRAWGFSMPAKTVFLIFPPIMAIVAFVFGMLANDSNYKNIGGGSALLIGIVWVPYALLMLIIAIIRSVIRAVREAR